MFAQMGENADPQARKKSVRKRSTKKQSKKPQMIQEIQEMSNDYNDSKQYDP